MWTGPKRHDSEIQRFGFELESGIQDIGIQNPQGPNPESKSSVDFATLVKAKETLHRG